MVIIFLHQLNIRFTNDNEGPSRLILLQKTVLKEVIAHSNFWDLESTEIYIFSLTRFDGILKGETKNNQPGWFFKMFTKRLNCFCYSQFTNSPKFRANHKINADILSLFVLEPTTRIQIGFINMLGTVENNMLLFATVSYSIWFKVIEDSVYKLVILLCALHISR